MGGWSPCQKPTQSAGALGTAVCKLALIVQQTPVKRRFGARLVDHHINTHEVNEYANFSRCVIMAMELTRVLTPSFRV